MKVQISKLAGATSVAPAVALLLCNLGFAQPDIRWTTGYNDGCTLMKAIRTTDGGFAIGTNAYAGPERGLDFWLIKTDSIGQVEWDSLYHSGNIPGHSADYARAIRQMPDGGYVLIGDGGGAEGGGMFIRTDTEGRLVWKVFINEVVPGCYLTCAVGTDGNIVIMGDNLVAKVSSQNPRHVIWERRLPHANIMPWLWSIEALPDGDFYISGITTELNARGSDFYIVRLNSDGEILWEGAYGSELNDNAGNITPTSDGGCLVVGAPLYDNDNMDNNHPLLVRLDADGNLLWSHFYTELPRRSSLGDAVELDDEGFVVLGHSEDRGANVYLVRIDYAGEVLWQRSYGHGHGVEEFDGMSSNSLILMNDKSYVVGFYSESLRGVCLFRTEPDPYRLPYDLAWPAPHDFDSLTVGSAAVWDCYVRNIGRRFAVLDSASFAGDTAAFSWTLELPRRINPTDTIYFPIAFHPPSDTSYTARLRLYYGNHQTVLITVRGWGLPPNGVADGGLEIRPTGFGLSASPNPFNSTTTIRFSLKADSKARLTVFDLSGREVSSLVNGALMAGYHSAVWNGEGLTSGIYLAKLSTSNGYMATRKLTLLK